MLVRTCVFMVVLAGAAWWVMVEPPLPHLEPDPWWAPAGDHKPRDTSIRKFTINISHEAVDDLATRLNLKPRLTPALQGANFTYGVNSDTLKVILDYWLHRYNWRRREARLNKYPHYLTTIEGLDIHYLHVTAGEGGKENRVVPLLLLHGWPGSFVEFYDLLPLLTSKSMEGGSVILEVICPSIPGYGFSQAPARQGFGHLETAQVMFKLMKRLGHERFYVQGGDWGSFIATAMATMYPHSVAGVHLNMFSSTTLGANFKMVMGALLPPDLLFSTRDRAKIYPLLSRLGMFARETGYLHIQATKPDTIGTAVNQSPLSLAAYILEKFSTWTHLDNPNLPDGGLLDPHSPISLDVILDNICVYWFTGTITSSMRYYAENFGSILTKNVENIPCRVPAGLAAFPQELATQPKSLAAHKFYDIVTYSDMPRGGHFPAMEEPQLLADDILSFITQVENRNHQNH